MWQKLYYRNTFELAWKEYAKNFPPGIDKKLAALADKRADITTDSFALYSSIATVFSSRIEGEDIQLDSYFKHKFQSVKYEPDYTKRADDLFSAYEFASKKELSYTNLVQAHTLLTQNILPSDKRGIVRVHQMFITNDQGNIRYVAAEAERVKDEFLYLMQDVEVLKQMALDNIQVFFFASFVHLLFVKIHPMYDGNGRTARLLEKWFLAHFIGKNAWHIESERYYYGNVKEYYAALNGMGVDYETSDYSKAQAFLQMLIKSL